MNTPAPTGMVYVEGGTFQMGSPTGSGEADEWPRHSVRLRSFYLDKYEVTVSEYRDYCTATGRAFPSQPSAARDNHPVVNVSWEDARQFAQWKGKRLPTEAEWEYAARGGALNRPYAYSGSDVVGDVAWYDVNAEGQTHPAGSRASNELGIFDLSGNVFEWCYDYYDPLYYSVSAPENPEGPPFTNYRVLRGGSWKTPPAECRNANRFYGMPNSFTSTDAGFRCAQDIAQ